MLHVDHVTKRFPPLVAVDDASFDVPRGAVLGLLGPNGAGKTTLVKLIAGLLYPDAGQIKAEPRLTVGLKPERLLFPNHLRVREYLDITARICNLAQADAGRAVAHALERVKLTGAAAKRIRECSKGMRQRLALAQTLIGAPELLLMDEPFDGLDPEGQDDVCRLIQELRRQGRTIILNSHQLHEVTQVCTHVIILSRGAVHYANTMADALAARPLVTIRATQDLAQARARLEALHAQIRVTGDEVTLTGEAIRLRREVLELLVKTGLDVCHVEQARATLHEVYAEVVR